MNQSVIITIARQSGSGGREIGKRVAEKLNIPFYDKEILMHAAEKSGLSQEVLSYYDEQPTNSLLYSLSTGIYSLNEAGVVNYAQPVNQRVFQAQFDTIRELAEKGSCVIVGRCADYVLENNPNVVSVFLHGNLEDRIKRVAEHEGISSSEAKSYINKSDKKRANYYNFYSGKKWGVASSYDLCINTSVTGYEQTADFIAEYAQKVMNNK
ncbi:MAG: cytidylate kinase-like family protein [Clostridia bacterium]|nr:cytidylate kinase-like family protein [Clostridia bacterium]